MTSRACSLMIIITALLSGCTTTGYKPTAVPAEELALGKKVYEQRCASCHGITGEGQYPSVQTQSTSAVLGAPPHNATGHSWLHSDAHLLLVIRKGFSATGFPAMPAFGNELSENEMQAVINYIKTWWQPEQLAAQATTNAKNTTQIP